MTVPLRDATNGAHTDQLQNALAEALLGRENHADSVSVAFMTSRVNGDEVRIHLGDAFTHTSVYLGAIPREDTAEIVPALFAQVRQWRERCNAGAASAKASAGGSR